jgi:hypothetical protein
MDSQLRDQTIFAVQAAVVELLELAALLEEGKESDLKESVLRDAEQTVLRFIAAIVVADGTLSSDEREFVTLLVNTKEKPGGDCSYLNEFAAEWDERSSRVPDFFERAVKHDIINKTTVARSMIREIQLIGNNICACDSRFGKREQSVVRNYISKLAEFVDLATAPTRF